ncbi:MAG TPA: ATP-dependent Clp protease adaptor ClpS [Treponemataceae bacterium]|nr:ATP-dependent Clp protease adaptor ClpS [Treponemataceae bacterium]
METVHRSKSAVVGVYPYDIAATRVALTINDARAQGFPLRCELEAV